MTDKSDQIARAALADALTYFPRWRSDVARIGMRAQRARGIEWAPMLSRCEEIEREITDLRADLILTLEDAPPKVCGHSRVIDIERALDNLEASLRSVKGRLQSVPSRQ